MEMCRPVKREKLQLCVFLLMRLNGWIDERVGGHMSDGEWWQMGSTMMNDVREETDERKNLKKRDIKRELRN